jgi:drug/metabolite transporter (DMT)-like permease
MTKEPIEAAVGGTDRVGLGIASITTAVFLFTIADATAKWLGQDYAPAQIVFLRYLFGILPAVLIVWRSGGIEVLRTRRPFAHGLRAMLIFGALFSFFTGLSHLPLAEAVAIAFTAPLFVTALSFPVLGERVGPRRWAAVIVGFLGALVMVRPGSEAFRVEALFILTSALFFALGMLLTRRMAPTETSAAMLTYTTLGAGLVCLPLMPFVWRPPADGDVWLFLLIALVGSSAAYLVITAYRHAPAAVVAPFDYTGLIWAALFGWVLWQEAPEPVVWLGAAIVALSGAYVAHRETASSRKAQDGG